ncbi:MAG: glycosyltransferase family 39 protein [Armatimonadota bacterium]|nr:glycosyltransferase family 39 protein [Armatimonadota bacterium]
MALAGICVMGLALRLYKLGAQSFWFDETVEVDVASRHLLDIVTWQGINCDALPPLSHYFFHFWLTLGSGEFWIRLLPALFGTATIYVIYRLAAHIFGRKQALIAALLLAVSPFHLWYSQEARPYAFLMFFSLSGMLYYLRAMERGGRVNCSLYVLCNLFAMYNHPYAAFIVLIQFVYAMAAKRAWPNEAKLPLVYFMAMAALYAPWIYISLGIAGRDIQDSKPLGVSALVYTFYAYTFGFSVGPSVAELRLNPSVSTMTPYIPLLAPLAAVYGFLFLRGVLVDRDQQIRRNLLLVAWIIIPMLGAFALAKLVESKYNARYVCAGMPVYILILAHGAATLRKHWRSAAVLFIVLSSLYSIHNYYFDSRYHKADVKHAADYVIRNEVPSDIIYVCSALPFKWYYTQRYSGQTDLTLLEIPLIKKQRVEKEQQIIGSGQYKRLWLVMNATWENHPNGRMLKSMFDRDYLLESRRDFTGLHVYKYRGLRKIK